VSYDLFLRPRAHPLTETEVLGYFRKRPHYSVEDREVFYENEATGVHFQFDFNDPGQDPEADGYPFVFRINLFRPSYFIREIEPEIAAFVDRFGCTGFDPQTHGMGEGDYDRDKLVSSWNQTNRFAYGALPKRRDLRERAHMLPRDGLDAIWQWNYGAKALSEEQNGDRFVPHIMAMTVDGALATMAVWPCCVPAILPGVDYLLIEREGEFAPEEISDEVWVPWSEAQAFLDRYGSPRPDGAVLFDYMDSDEAVLAVAAFITSLEPREHDVVGVRLADILDKELAEAALAGA
jgi:hypothetical protein